jgi:hypothetical protein
MILEAVAFIALAATTESMGRFLLLLNNFKFPD